MIKISTNSSDAIDKYRKVGFILINDESSKIIVIKLIITKIARFIRVTLEIRLFWIYSSAVNMKVVITKPIVAINILKNLYNIKNITIDSISKTFDTFYFDLL